MKLVITNTNSHVLPIMSDQEGGWADALAPDTPYPLDRPTTVLILGDKPGFLDALRQTLENVSDLITSLVARWRHRDEVTDVSTMVVDCVLTNDGERPVRVILGDNTNDVELAAGVTSQFSAPNYIELRELEVGTPAHEAHAEGA